MSICDWQQYLVRRVERAPVGRVKEKISLNFNFMVSFKQLGNFKFPDEDKS